MTVVTSDTKRIIALEMKIQKLEDRIQILEDLKDTKIDVISRIDLNLTNAIADIRKIASDLKSLHQVIVAIRQRL